ARLHADHSRPVRDTGSSQPALHEGPPGFHAGPNQNMTRENAAPVLHGPPDSRSDVQLVEAELSICECGQLFRLRDREEAHKLVRERLVLPRICPPSGQSNDLVTSCHVWWFLPAASAT